MSDRFYLMGMAIIGALVVIVFIIALGVEESDTNNKAFYDEPGSSPMPSTVGQYEISQNTSESLAMNQDDRDDIESKVSYIQSLFAQKDVSKLYDLLDSEYKRMMFNDENDFESYLEKEYPSEGIKVKDFKVEYGFLYINFLINNSEEKQVAILNYTNPDNKSQEGVEQQI